jgi:hypothetical protein
MAGVSLAWVDYFQTPFYRQRLRLDLRLLQGVVEGTEKLQAWVVRPSQNRRIGDVRRSLGNTEGPALIAATRRGFRSGQECLGLQLGRRSVWSRSQEGGDRTGDNNGPTEKSRERKRCGAAGRDLAICESTNTKRKRCRKKRARIPRKCLVSAV